MRCLVLPSPKEGSRRSNGTALLRWTQTPAVSAAFGPPTWTSKGQNRGCLSVRYKKKRDHLPRPHRFARQGCVVKVHECADPADKAALEALGLCREHLR